jgi:hypothetical protein
MALSAERGLFGGNTLYYANNFVMSTSKPDEKVVLSTPGEGWQGGGTKPQWPPDFRKFMGWIFLVVSLVNVTVSLRFILYAVRRHYAIPRWGGTFVELIFPMAVAAICGAAWWTTWRGNSSARTWGIAGSIMCLLIFLRQFVVPSPLSWDYQVAPLLIGILGLKAFWGRKRPAGA